MYEARVLDIHIQGEDVIYFIHYMGWNKRWDEWLHEDHVFEYNDKNILKTKELMRKHNPLASKKKAAVSKPKKGQPVKQTSPPAQQSVINTAATSTTKGSRSRTQKQG